VGFRPVTPLAQVEMENLIGHDVDRWPALIAEPEARLWLYGKTETRDGRKMGHILASAGSANEARTLVEEAVRRLEP
jgi:phosphoribosylaminoimidazole carboxylase (NCAIR synthetase)